MAKETLWFLWGKKETSTLTINLGGGTCLLAFTSKAKADEFILSSKGLRADYIADLVTTDGVIKWVEEHPEVTYYVLDAPPGGGVVVGTLELWKLKMWALYVSGGDYAGFWKRMTKGTVSG